MPYQTVKGTYDTLPDQMIRVNMLSDLFRQFLNLYGYSEIKTPVFEYTGVFQKKKHFLTFSVPREQATTTGTPAFCAILKEPAWKGSSSPVRLRVPSG